MPSAHKGKAYTIRPDEADAAEWERLVLEHGGPKAAFRALIRGRNQANDTVDIPAILRRVADEVERRDAPKGRARDRFSGVKPSPARPPKAE